VFEIVLNVASLGIISTWGFIIVCQMKFRAAVKRGDVDDVPFKMPGAPVTSWLTLLFLLGVLVLMAFDYPNGTCTVASIPVVALLLVIGWRWVSGRATRVPFSYDIHSSGLMFNSCQTGSGVFRIRAARNVNFHDANRCFHDFRRARRTALVALTNRPSEREPGRAWLSRPFLST